MVKKSATFILALGATLIAGCESNTGTGALVGGAGGAAIGVIAGGGTGALIGGAAGVIAGGLIGAYLDDQESKNLKKQSSQTYRRVDNGEKLSVNDIIHLSQSDITDDKIIGLIRKTNSHYVLNTYQVDKLREAEVSEGVINYMLYNT
ncbi:MAG: glycine zipper domain-containing protein [Chlamydiota bacterium]